jgi:hypothetical protein
MMRFGSRMYIALVPNRSSPPAVLLRESYRDGDSVKTRTLANLTRWPADKVEALRRVLKGETSLSDPTQRFQIERSLPHGHVAAVLGMARKLGLDRLWPGKPERLAKLTLAMIVARVIEPAAKLATARQLSEDTAAHSLGAVLGLGGVDEDELYAALDWLGLAQPKIEAALAHKHLKTGCLVLYDSPPPTSKDAAANSPNTATAATDNATSRRSSSACCAPPMGVRSRSRCSRAIPLTPRRWPPRSRNCASASSSTALRWSAIAG